MSQASGEKKKVLTLSGIGKSFPGVRALNNVSFDVYEGEVHALMGENGAGKSTLMKIIAGLYSCDEGTMELDGRKVEFSNALDAIQNGISMVHQELMPVLDMTVAENIFLGREPVIGKSALVAKRKMNRDTEEYLNMLNVKINPSSKMRSLRVAQIQMVEIAKALSRNARVIIMDEPTSSISDRECDNLFAQIRKLKENGVAIIYISHKMDEIFRISDRITVLRDGEWIGSKPASELDENELIKMMVGRELTQVFPPHEPKGKDEILRVEGFSSGKLFQNINFSLKRGEILGFAGLVGAGRTELMESIFGLRKGASGKIIKDGKEIVIKNPLDAIRNRLALIPEDRKNVGLDLIESVRSNLTIANLSEYTKGGFVDKTAERRVSTEMVEKLNIKTPSLEQAASKLSGGNQQKIVIGKWLLTKGEIIIMDEPTRGIDIKAKSEIYALIHELVDEGKSIIFISSEMPEIIGISDRVIVMCEGKITGELKKEELGQERIMELASGIKL